MQRKIAKRSLQFLEEKYGEERQRNVHLNILYEKLKVDLDFFNQESEELNTFGGTSLTSYQNIYLEMLEQQRKMLEEMNRIAECDEELIQEILVVN